MSRTDYGIDALPVIRRLGALGLLGLTLGLGLPRLVPTLAGAATSLGIAGGIFGLEALLMLLYARWGKYRHRARLLAPVAWRGDEQVLDVGTGRGLLALGAARHLTAGGHATGVDIWQEQDLSGNTPANFARNAEAEGVADRVTLRQADARQLPFPDGSFDVVLSNLCLHNIPDAAGRAQACREIGRVLRPGGRAVLSDFRKNREYAAVFQEMGYAVERRGPFLLDTFPPLAVLLVRRAA